MRIISKFHDYYDSVQSLGQDRSLIYMRDQKKVELEKWPFHAVGGWSSFTLSIRNIVIGFCGKYYPLLDICPTYHVKPKISFNDTLCYSLDEVDKLIKNHYREDVYENFISKKYTKKWSFDIRKERIKEYYEQKFPETDYFKESPIWVAYKETDKVNSNIVFNEQLKTLDFTRIVDPYTAFQTLQMYLSNIAVPMKEIPKLDDTTMAEIKGFDKYSFRKDKQK